MPQVNFPEAFHAALTEVGAREGSLVWTLDTKAQAYGVKMKIYRFLARAREGVYGADKQAIAQCAGVRQISPAVGAEGSLIEWTYGPDTSLDAVMARSLGSATDTRVAQWQAYVRAMLVVRGPLMVDATDATEGQWDAMDRARAVELGIDFETGAPIGGGSAT